MKHLKYLLFILPFLFINTTYALDYTHINKFAGIDSTQKIGNFIDSNSDVIGQAYYSLPKNLAYNYLVLTYCSSSDRVQPGFAPNTYVTDSIYHVDTKQYCDTNYNSVTGTIKMNFFTIKNWYYNEDQAYLDVSYSYFHNSDSQYSQAFQFLGLSSQSSQDVSIAILAYLKSQETNQDYTTILNEIKNNQSDYKKELQDVNSSIQKTNDTLKDDTVDTSKTKIDDKSADASKSPISSLLTLPIKLLNNINTGLSGTCSSFNLGTLFGTELSLPCISLEQRLGSFLWGLIDSFFCIFLIYNVGMLAVKIWTDVIMMKDFFSQLYSPQAEKGGKKE